MRERLTEYMRLGLVLKRRDSKDRIISMKLDILRIKISCIDMEANVFTHFLEKDPTIETSGKYRTVFSSDYVPSAVQEPNIYGNFMRTYFINPIHTTSHSDDGSNVTFDVYHTFKG